MRRAPLLSVLPLLLLAAALLALPSCSPDAPRSQAPTAVPGLRPDLLLVTLDTTRADAMTAEVAPNFVALAGRGLRFSQAYATAPQTLPAHASMLTGLYPAAHGVRENSRRLGGGHELVAERLAKLGYRTAAFVSGFPLDGQFGLDRGFEIYDDDLPGGVERSARETTDRALATLGARQGDRPLFLWVHYYDPHDPYSPPEPYRTRFAADPYRGEIAAMDEQLGRLVAAFATPARPHRLLVLADHGEGRGDHGEWLHGNLLYQGVMAVPLVLVGTGIAPGERTEPVSARQVFATLLEAAGEAAPGSLLATPSTADAAVSPVLGEAMQPFLQYRWQPQTMAVAGRLKVIRSGRFEQYDVVADPAERHDLARSGEVERTLAREIANYPIPSPASATASAPADEEARRRLQSLGYLAGGSSVPREVPPDAPRAVDRTALFAELDSVSRSFGAADYAGVQPLLEKLLRIDPMNPSLALRAAVAHSALGHDAEATRSFARARAIDPDSIDARHYEALHHLRAGRPEQAAPLLVQVLAAQPERRAALAALAGIRMAEGQTEAALALFERARAVAGEHFEHDLELGVLYLAARRFEEAAQALDRVEPADPGYPMALFKRAQVAVLLQEPDAAARIQLAKDLATPATRELIARERLFGR